MLTQALVISDDNIFIHIQLLRSEIYAFSPSSGHNGVLKKMLILKARISQPNVEKSMSLNRVLNKAALYFA